MMSRRKVTPGTPPKLARALPRTRPGAAHSAPAATPAGPRTAAAAADEAASSPLGTYFHELAGLDVMRPEEEFALATRLTELRRALWTALLDYPPFVEPIAALMAAHLSPEDLPPAELDALRVRARALRDRETRATRQAFEAARRAIVERALEADRDNVVSDLVHADLEALAAGKRDGLTLQVNPPRRGSRPFAAYVEQLQKTRQALRDAKHAFVKANLRLVVAIARRYDHGVMPLQDLIQEGNIGLMKAIDRFDPRRGFRFSTYGSWWIRHAISRAIADKGREVRLPVHVLEAQHKLARARREIESQHGRAPRVDELSERTGLTSKKIERIGAANFGRAISLDRPLFDEDGARAIDLLEDPSAEAPGESLEIEALSEQVREAIERLTPIEADILRKRFGLDDRGDELTLKEIGEQYSLSRERIRQLQERALRKIRRELENGDAAA